MPADKPAKTGEENLAEFHAAQADGFEGTYEEFHKPKAKPAAKTETKAPAKAEAKPAS